MILDLFALPDSLRGPDDLDYRGKVPKRFRFLAPDAATSLLALDRKAGGLVYTDMFRDAQAQLRAYQTKGGTQKPSYSAHGYGLAVDLDVRASCSRCSLTYAELSDHMATGGWYCHRRDLDAAALESWHFNFGVEYFLPEADPENPSTWSIPAELCILERYGSQMKMTAAEISASLLVLGGLSVTQFQQVWGLKPDGIAGPKTQRMLAYVTATKNIVNTNV